jgi:hypothetical protein
MTSVPLPRSAPTRSAATRTAPSRTGPSRIALLTQLPSLVDQCSALADGIGIALSVAAPTTGGWQDAALVLLGEDVAEPPRGITAPTVLIAVDDATSAARTSTDAYAAAARLGADQVAILPAAAEWLVQRMIAAVEPPVAPATTAGIVPGCGGAGATVLAAALALEAQRAGLPTVLVDADPLGGGTDLVLGAEAAPGPPSPRRRAVCARRCSSSRCPGSRVSRSCRGTGRTRTTRRRTCSTPS